ncbi:hypothetical protein QR680_005842 [Steinernema hermaphroditum]|uniref:Uncharacterized protein n=1 Tax=Steinernema hermaphroditum TaxID=289476 RepID=A0AA39LVK9_9BILA|nr:hypothetical protein QR680_005842 [Steinernema hermaphroditum]
MPAACRLQIQQGVPPAEHRGFESVDRSVRCKMRAAIAKLAVAFLLAACVLNAFFVAAEDPSEAENELLKLMDGVVALEKISVNFPQQTIVHLLNTDKLKEIMQKRLSALSEAMFLKLLKDKNKIDNPLPYTPPPPTAAPGESSPQP